MGDLPTKEEIKHKPADRLLPADRHNKQDPDASWNLVQRRYFEPIRPSNRRAWMASHAFCLSLLANPDISIRCVRLCWQLRHSGTGAPKSRRYVSTPWAAGYSGGGRRRSVTASSHQSSQPNFFFIPKNQQQIVIGFWYQYQEFLSGIEKKIPPYFTCTHIKYLLSPVYVLRAISRLVRQPATCYVNHPWDWCRLPPTSSHDLRKL